jgi:phosphatidylglycerol---prolipoprotein diacylglyceryl transferase
MIYLHNLDPIALHLPFWPHGIHWYGIMYLTGFAIAYFIGMRRVRAGRLPGVNEEGLSDLLFYAMVGVVLGGRIGYILFYNFPEFIADPIIAVSYQRRRHEFSRRFDWRDAGGSVVVMET